MKSPAIELSKSVIGMHGVYRVAAELTGRGYTVSTTSRSAKGIDLHATSPDLKKTFSVEVKTICRIKSRTFGLSELIDSPSFNYVLLNYEFHSQAMINFHFYIVPSREMIKIAKPGRASKNIVFFKQLHQYKDAWIHFN